MAARKKLRVDVKMVVLHEAAFKCANPRCRYPITLDKHHLEQHSEGGSDEPDNLLALCPTFHTEHHAGNIPIESLRAWKMLLVTLNEAFDRRGIDLLLALDKMGELALSGGDCAPLVASDLIDIRSVSNGPVVTYFAKLNKKGKLFVEGWIAGDMSKAIPTPA
jgi:hypothetical protein